MCLFFQHRVICAEPTERYRFFLKEEKELERVSSLIVVTVVKATTIFFLRGASDEPNKI